ncbi:hypothetical protein H2198_010318 [Neophaeococcomyces mojaviensis]|uniref:Uncharacterized protein n=1 Tax=Neophaeococcomyces mojaviensis TaxID=3383035 RepID=A0ACC2ZRW9_9EURO|nr:hypothetical protein H2198_010318 [Knufia sp. JES_112]
MVALRPEALRQMEALGALQYITNSKTGHGDIGSLTRMTKGKTASEIDGGVFEWPLKRYPPSEPQALKAKQDESYDVPQKVNDQVPSYFIDLGDLEDALSKAAEDNGIELIYDASICLVEETEGNAYRVQLVHNAEPSQLRDLGIPDLVVCASGKNDHFLEKQLSFTRHIGVLLTDENLPDTNDPTSPRTLRFRDGANHEIESQLFSVFGIKTSPKDTTMGVLDHVIRKYNAENTLQPVVEIQMNHASAVHCLLQLPRHIHPLSTSPEQLEQYINSRINARLNTFYTSISDMRNADAIVWGDPLTPVTVETSTASQYVFGTNVVLVGDAAMSCSPSSGIGAEIGLTVDSRSIRELAVGLRDAIDEREKAKVLNVFNLRKAESAVMWSKGSRAFYITRQEADEILEKIRDASKS